MAAVIGVEIRPHVDFQDLGQGHEFGTDGTGSPQGVPHFPEVVGPAEQGVAASQQELEPVRIQLPVCRRFRQGGQMVADHVQVQEKVRICRVGLPALQQGVHERPQGRSGPGRREDGREREGRGLQRLQV